MSQIFLQLPRLLFQIKFLRDNEKTLSVSQLLEQIRDILQIAQKLEDDLQAIAFRVDATLYFKKPVDYFTKILDNLDEKQQNPDVNIPLAETMEDLYQMEDTLKDVPDMQESERNKALNLIQEVCLVINQHTRPNWETAQKRYFTNQ